MEKLYREHEGRVINTDNKFSHVMAIALDPRTNYKEGVIRCITSRKGDVSVGGYIDRSELYKIKGSSLENFEIEEKLIIKNEREIIKELIPERYEFIGLEDPDIWIDEKNDLLHLYFTLPLINNREHARNKIYLGHAVGKSLESLEMTTPVLFADEIGGAKELSVAPINKKGVRFNLVESSKKEKDFNYSVIRTAVAQDMNGPWKFGDIVFHPKEYNISWIGGHASPGPLFSKSFIDVGEGKLVGIINGREANQKREDGRTKYGMFSIGLFIYDYENGKIDWVSPEPFIQDSKAKTITFASQFIETKEGEGILYAHVDDSFIRAYTLKADLVKFLLPNIDKKYAGVLLITPEGSVLLQQRDNKPNIMNPGLVTTFGGSVEEGEKPEQTAIREIGEECCLKLSANDILFFKIFEKNKIIHGEDNTCYIYIAKDIDKNNLTVREGKGFVEISKDNNLNDYKLSILAKEILEDYFSKQ